MPEFVPGVSISIDIYFHPRALIFGLFVDFLLFDNGLEFLANIVEN